MRPKAQGQVARVAGPTGARAQRRGRSLGLKGKWLTRWVLQAQGAEER